MNGHQLDELLKRKVDNARRGKTLRTAALALALLAIIVLIGTAVHRHKTKAVNVPDAPSAVETEEEPTVSEPEEENTQTTDAPKPLQPEEMRRKQNKHELVLQWEGVSEADLPPMVTVTVLCRGEEVARFTLSGESEWRHSWTDDYPAEDLSLRAELPKSVMASFTLRGNQFIMFCSGSGAASVSAPAAGSEEGEASEEETGEPGSEEEAPNEAESDEEAPGEAEPEEEAPTEAEPEEASVEAQPEAEAQASEISDPPRSAHSWWPIVLLLLCGAVLVTLGVLGTDRRRSR